MQAVYPNNECPDCSEPIPADALPGEECINCGHVFYKDAVNDDQTTDSSVEPQAVFCCRECNGVNVQYLDWTDANLSIVLGNNESDDNATWCEDCNDHTGLTLREVTDEEYDRLMAARQQQLKNG